MGRKKEKNISTRRKCVIVSRDIVGLNTIYKD